MHAASDLPRVQAAPPQRAVDPAAARPGAQQARHQPRRPGDAARMQRQLDRERGADSLRRGCLDQRAQRPLPRRALRPRRGPVRRAQALRRRSTECCASVRGGDHQRRHVLTVVSHRTRALAVLERQRPAPATDEEGGGVVERTLADHRAPQRLGVRVPLDPGHPAAACVDAAAIERPRPHHGLDPGQLDVAQLAGRAHHDRNVTVAPDRSCSPRSRACCRT